MKKAKRFLSLLLTLTLLLSLWTITAFAADLEAAISYNRDAADYIYTMYAPRAKSFLYTEGNELVRVEYIEDEEYIKEELVVEHYSASFELLSTQTITLDSGFTEWGGCFIGESYNYVFLGQANTEESDEVEVIRVIQYDKEWQRLACVGIYGENTVYPFEAGSLRCAEYGDMLYVHTCHQMYKSTDGLRHQANMTFAVSQSEMTVTDVQSAVSSKYSYAAHSFNQFILIDQEKRIITLDHADGSPRGIQINCYTNEAGSETIIDASRYSIYNYNEFTIQTFSGTSGDNVTGAAVGGIAETSSGYVTLYTYDGTADHNLSSPHNVYLAYTSKDDFSESGTTVREVKTYESEASFSRHIYEFENGVKQGYITNIYGIGTPILVPIGLDGGYLIWKDANEDNMLCYATYDAEGNVGEIQMAKGALSDCQPIVWGDKIVWYVTFGDTPIFYTLDEDGLHISSRVEDWSADDGSTTVTMDSFGTDLSDAVVYAATYNDEGKMTTVAAAEIEDYTLTFSQELTAGTKLFILDSETYAPLCPSVELEE